MPIVNGNYVAPTWINGQSPAINASELQAICDSLEQAGNSIAMLMPMLTSAGKIETGSYTGTGATGSANPVVLSFSITPKLVVVQDNAAVGFAVFVNPATKATSLYNTSVNATGLTVAWTASGMSFYGASSSAANNLNKSGDTYNYVAIGL